MATKNNKEPRVIARADWRTRQLRLALVYQAGIANVFVVDTFTTFQSGRNAERLYQGDFRTAETMCHGAALAGAVVRTFACNMAGDVAGTTWTEDLDAQPFSEKFYPQVWN